MLQKKLRKLNNNLISFMIALGVIGVFFIIHKNNSHATTFDVSNIVGKNYAVEEDKNITISISDDRTILTLQGSGTLKNIQELPWYTKNENEYVWPEEIIECRIIGTSIENPIYANADSSNLFFNAKSLKNISFINFNTENIKNIRGMFRGCSNLENLDLSNFVLNKVDDMSNLFRGCTSLKQIDLSGFNTKNVTSMYSLFYNCKNVENIYFGENFDATKCQDTSHMFFGCQNLLEIDFGDKFNTKNVKNMEYMFFNCNKITYLNLGKLFDTSNVTNMSCMFCACRVIESIDVSTFNTSKVTDMSNMFDDCQKLINLDLSNFDTKNVKNMDYMFYNCYSLINLNVSSFDTAKVEKMRAMFRNCKNIEQLDLLNFDTSFVTTMAEMFWNCEKLIKLDLSSFNTSLVTNMNHMFFGCKALEELELRTFDTSNVTDMSSMFCHLEKLKAIELNNFNTSNVTDMNEMFYGCKTLTSLNLESFQTSNVTNMNEMFHGLENVKFLNLTNFDTSKITDMSYMFFGCTNLQNLNVSSFNTENVTNMKHMFFGCKSLIEIDITSFRTNNVSNMSSMFTYLPFSTIDLSNFNTSNVIDMNEMFYGCRNLENLNLENFDFSNVKNIQNMFYDCKILSNLKLGNFKLNAVENAKGAFQNCLALKNLDLRNFDFTTVTSANNFILGCTSLEVLRTPLNVSSSLEQEVKFSKTMYDIDSNHYLTLPVDNSNSIVLFSEEFLETLLNLKGDAISVEDKVIAYEKLPDVTKEYIQSIDEYANAIDEIKLEYYELLGNNITNKILSVDENGKVNESLEVFGIIKNVEKDLDGDGVDDFDINLNTVAIEGSNEEIRNKVNEISNLENVLISYDINLEKFNNVVIEENITPTSNILVKMTLPIEYYDKILNVYHIDDANNVELVDKQIQKFEDKCLVYFETDAFSPYTITSAMKCINVTSEGNGTVLPNSNVYLSDEELTKTFKLTLEDNSYAEIYIDGVYIKAVNNTCNYILQNVEKDVNLHVKFLKNVEPSKNDEENEEDKEEEKNDLEIKPNDDKKENSGFTANVTVVDVQNKYHVPYITGFKDNTFRPNLSITRGEVAAILARINEDYKGEKDYKRFIKDDKIQNSLWSSNYIGFMYASGIMQGDEKGFRASDNITRAEFAKTMVKFLKIDTTSTETSTNYFIDVNGNSWYAKSVIELSNRGIITGYNDGTFKPANNITRAEVTKVINAALKRIINRELNKSQITDLKNKFTDINENAWYFKDIYEASIGHGEQLNH